MDLERRTRRHDAALQLDRQARAVELAIAGWSYDAIARELGYATRSGAWKAVQRALQDRVAHGVDELRELELARLEQLHHAHWAAALHGDHKSATVVLRAMDKRIRLMGLEHEPERVEPMMIVQP